MKFQEFDAILKDQSVSGTAKHVLTVLAARTNDAGQCYASKASISRDTGLSKSTVQRALGGLLESGHIQRSGRTIRVRMTQQGGVTVNPPGVQSEPQTPPPTSSPDLSSSPSESKIDPVEVGGPAACPGESVKPVSSENAMAYPKNSKSAGDVLADYDGGERTLDEVLATFETLPVREKNLAKCYKLAYTVLYPGHFVSNIPAHQLKYLRAFGKQHGTETFKRLATCVARWPTFAERCKEWTGKPPPAKPNIGYLAGRPQEVHDFVEGEGQGDGANVFG